VLKDKLQQKRKLLAALVITTGLATLVSALGVPKAGDRVSRGCRSSHWDSKGAMLPLELGQPIPLGGPVRAGCILAGLDAMLGADTIFLISYSALNLTLFLFLVGLGRLRPALLWVSAGVVLSAVMFFGDLFENRALYEWIGQARRTLGSMSPDFPLPPPPLLALATTSKWIALAVASALCGLAYLFQRRWFLRFLALPGALAAGFLLLGISRSCQDWINYGVTALGLLWAGGLVHAVVVVLEEVLPAARPIAREGGAPRA
jgi:hypothetical protein